MNRQLDILFVHPSSAHNFQGLRSKYSAIEPPTWSLLLAQSVRSVGYGAAILDCEAEGLGLYESALRIGTVYKPRLACFVVYGSEPNQGTSRMAGAAPLLETVKRIYPEVKTCLVGSYAQACPLEALSLSGVDFVLTNEGVYALRNLLATDLVEMEGVKGVAYCGSFGQPCLNPPETTVPQSRMDVDLPGYAWDLLPKMGLYRSHFWFGQYDHAKCTPYAALYTSLGCPYKCSFCMINSINRDSNDANWTSADSAGIRYFNPYQIVRELEYLHANGVMNIRFSDEMFFLKRHHYEPLLKMIQNRFRDELNLWAYARVDTVKPDMLSLFRQAGVRWLCLGIESGNQTVRREVTKGSYEEVDVRRVVKEVEDAGIEVIANYIFGLPKDTHETMEETLDLSIELNTAMWNAYPCMALPGTPLHQDAKRDGIPLPDTFSGYGFYSYDCLPLPTKTLTAAEVLRFRDEAFVKYWDRPEFTALLTRRFGPDAARNVANLLTVKLPRKILGDPAPEGWK